MTMNEETKHYCVDCTHCSRVGLGNPYRCTSPTNPMNYVTGWPFWVLCKEKNEDGVCPAFKDKLPEPPGLWSRFVAWIWRKR